LKLAGDAILLVGRGSSFVVGDVFAADFRDSAAESLKDAGQDEDKDDDSDD
jgi:hypothetical protein